MKKAAMPVIGSIFFLVLLIVLLLALSGFNFQPGSLAAWQVNMQCFGSSDTQIECSYATTFHCESRSQTYTHITFGVDYDKWKAEINKIPPEDRQILVYTDNHPQGRTGSFNVIAPGSVSIDIPVYCDFTHEPYPDKPISGKIVIKNTAYTPPVEPPVTIPVIEPKETTNLFEMIINWINNLLRSLGL